MCYRTHDAELHALFIAGDGDEESSLLVVLPAAAQTVAHLVAKRRYASETCRVGLHRKLFGRKYGRRSRPTLAVENNVGVDRLRLLADEVHRLDVVDAHEVETEAVNMILLHPIFDALYHVLAEHLCLRCRLIAAAGGIGWCAVGIVTEEISRRSALETALPKVEDMVVNDIHHDADACLVQCHHHLLELPDAGGGGVGVCAVRPFRHVVVDRVVAPVVGGRHAVAPAVSIAGSLVDAAVVVRGQEMDMCHAKLFQMVDAC